MKDLVDEINEREQRQEELEENELLSDECDFNDFDLIHESFNEEVL